MRSKRLYQWGLGTAAAGILLLLVLSLSGIAAPNPLFTVLALGGLLFCAAGIVLFAAGWLRDLIRAIRRHDTRQVLLLLLGAALILLRALLRR